MRHSRTGCLLAALLAASAAGQAGPDVARFRVDSEPSGAEVHVINGRAGTTPTSLSERDIYPNTYPPDRIDLYGVVILRKTGCEPWRKRVTRADIRDGLHAELDCLPRGRAPETGAAEVPPSTAASPRAAPAPVTEPLAEKRLRQLRVIEELHDEGLLSAGEASRIRRRILTAD